MCWASTLPALKTTHRLSCVANWELISRLLSVCTTWNTLIRPRCSSIGLAASVLNATAVYPTDGFTVISGRYNKCHSPHTLSGTGTVTHTYNHDRAERSCGVSMGSLEALYASCGKINPVWSLTKLSGLKKTWNTLECYHGRLWCYIKSVNLTYIFIVGDNFISCHLLNVVDNRRRILRFNFILTDNTLKYVPCRFDIHFKCGELVNMVYFLGDSDIPL